MIDPIAHEIELEAEALRGHRAIRIDKANSEAHEAIREINRALAELVALASFCFGFPLLLMALKTLSTARLQKYFQQSVEPLGHPPRGFLLHTKGML